MRGAGSCGHGKSERCTLTTFVPSAAETKKNGRLCFSGKANDFWVTL